MDEEDDDFDVAKGSDRLASLFSLSASIERKEEDPNQMLKYVPPKQPKQMNVPSDNSSDNGKSQLTVIQAAAVNAFRYIDRKYTAVGKVGCALLGNTDVHIYRLVLYTGKQNYIANAKISRAFKFVVQPNCYSTFYDDQSQPWSILFDSVENMTQFSKQIAFARFHSSLSPSAADDRTILVHDIIPGTDDTTRVEEKDNIELKFKAWTTELDMRSAKLYDSSDTRAKPFRTRASALGVEWCQSILGMTTACHRLVICPKNCKDSFAQVTEKAATYDEQPDVLFAFEFELVKIKVRDSQERRGSIDGKSTTASQPISSEPMSNQDIERATGQQDNLNSSNRERGSSKSEILQRMARLGTATIMVPQNASQAVEEPANADDLSFKPIPKTRTSSSASATGSEVVLSTDTVTAPISRPPSSTNILANSVVFPNFPQQQFASQPVDASAFYLLNEMRTNNTQTKLLLDNLTSKVDTLVHKVDEVKSSSGASSSDVSTFKLSGLSVDTAFLLGSIQKIVDENVRLKEELDDKNKRLMNLNEKICDLLQSNNERKQNQIQIDDGTLSRLRDANEHLKRESTVLKAQMEEALSQNATIEAREKKDSASRLKKAMKLLYSNVMSELSANDNDLNTDTFDELLRESIRNVTTQVLTSPSRPVLKSQRSEQAQIDDSVSPEDEHKYMFFDPKEKVWKPQPPEAPEIEIEDRDDDADL